MRMALPMMIALGLAGPAVALELTSEQMDLLTRDLNDPESARVRNLSSPPDLPEVFCGEINWRNEQGGFGGYKRFWLATTANQSAIEPDPQYRIGAGALGCS